MRTRIAAAPLAAALLFTATPGPAMATPRAPGGDALTWSVAPSGPEGPNGRPALEYKLDPGASLTDQVAVTNHSDRALTLRLYANDAFTTAGGGFDLLAGTAAPADAATWVKLARTTVTLPRSSRVIVPFTVRVPGNATPGDHAAGIVASLTAARTGADGNQVTVDHRVGTRVYLRVAGPLRPRLGITDVRVTRTTPWNPLRLPHLTATFTVDNPGNVRLSGRPTARVHGLFGAGVRTADAPAIPEILPGGAVRTSVRLDAVPALFRERLDLSVLPAAADGRAIDPLPARTGYGRTVWLVPWSQLAVLVLAAALLATWLGRRRRHRRRLAEAIADAERRGRDQAGTPAPTTVPEGQQ